MLTWMVLDRVGEVVHSGMTTGDFLLPVWPFFAVASLGLVLAVIVIPAYLYRLILHGRERPVPNGGSRE
jgi:hypothetical protein